MTKNLQKALEDQKKQNQQEIAQIAGSLGIPIGGLRRVEVPNRNSYVFVRLRDNPNEVIQAFNNKVAASYNLPVIVERQNNRYIVIGVDTLRYQNNWNSYSPYLARHGNTHSFDYSSGGGGDIVFIYPRQFMPSLIMPSGSVGGPNTIMNGYVLRNSDGTWKYTGVTGTPSYLPYKPTGSSAVMVLTYLDSVSGNPYLLVGNSFAGTITGSAEVTPYIPTLTDANAIPLSAIRLVSGTSSIGWDNIYDARQFIHVVPTGTSSGGGGTGTNSILIQDEGIPKGTVQTLNFVGPNVDATVSGTVARIFVTGSTGGGGSGITQAQADALYLRLDTQNKPLTGPLDIIPTGTNLYGEYVELRGDATGMDVERYSGSGTVNADLYFGYQEIQGNNNDTGIFLDGVRWRSAGTGTFTGDWISLEQQNAVKFNVDKDGNAYTRGTLLVPDAASDGQTYARKNAGWITISASGTFVFVQDEGIPLGTAQTFNFVGQGVDASVSGTVVRVFVTGSAGLTLPQINNQFLRLDAANRPITNYLTIIPTGTTGGTGALTIQGQNDSLILFPYRQSFGTDVNQHLIYGLEEILSSGTVTSNFLRADRTRTAGTGSFTGDWIVLRNQGVTQFNVDNDGDAYTRGTLLVQDAASDSQTYARKNAAWVGISPSGTFVAAETNTNDIFQCSNPSGTSAFAGTIATLPGGATLTYNVTSGTEGAMVPASTSQLGKMRLYNTTRGTSALISNCNTVTNTLTLTANVPVGWVVGDVITIASQTVSGGGLSWTDIEITSGPINKSSIFVNVQIVSTTAGDTFRLHPFTASFSASRYVAVNALVASQTTNGFGLLSITSNLFSLAWSGSVGAVVVREAGYIG